MQVNQSQFKDILKSIPSIEVSLSWYHNEGQGFFEKEIQIEPYLLNTNFSCYESGIFDNGDTFTPPSFSSDGVEVCDIEANIFNDEGEEITLTIEQKEKLSKEIQISIISN